MSVPILRVWDETQQKYVGLSAIREEVPAPGVTMDLLWTNASPTSSFGAQTVSVNLSGYDLYMVIGFAYNKSISVLSKIGDGAALCGAWGDNGVYFTRQIEYSDTGLDFKNAYASKAVTNTTCIPQAIYGIKGVT